MKDNTISEVDFSNPDEVVFCFIGSAKDLLKKTDIASTDLMDIVAFYTTLKYHPYDNHLHLLKQIAYVREIEKTIINGKPE